MSTAAAIRPKTATRHLTLVGAPRGRVSAAAVDRDLALERVRRARRHVDGPARAAGRPRSRDLDRFAYLARNHD